jgi:hypothetical protein
MRRMAHGTTLLVSILLFVVSRNPARAFSICGHYCGPNWCNAMVSAECEDPVGSGCHKKKSDCTEVVPTDGSCADACCRIHDRCCGSPNRTVCNDVLIACLDRCQGGSNDKCRDPSTGFPVHPNVIKIAMKVNPFGCCGTSCKGMNSTRNQLFLEFQRKMLSGENQTASYP